MMANPCHEPDMIQIEFTQADIEQLHYERFHHPHPRVQQRMEALYLKALGQPIFPLLYIFVFDRQKVHFAGLIITENLVQ